MNRFAFRFSKKNKDIDNTNTEISSKDGNEKSISVLLKTGFLSKLDGMKSDVLFKGITKRWATNTLLITALILLVLVTACVCANNSSTNKKGFISKSSDKFSKTSKLSRIKTAKRANT